MCFVCTCACIPTGGTCTDSRTSATEARPRRPDTASVAGTSPPAESTSEAPVVADVIPMGTVEGRVRLAPGAALPGYDTNPMISAAASAAMPSDCPPPNDGDRQPVQIGSSGGLTNLVIVATGDPEHWPDTAGPRTRTARIERCRLEPRTLVAERGDTIHFETELNFPFFPDLGTGFSRALLPTDPLDLVLDQGWRAHHRLRVRERMWPHGGRHDLPPRLHGE